MKWSKHLLTGMVLGAMCCSSASAQPRAASSGIYTCIDASGVRITADRPIPQCADREQRVLSPSGLELKRVGPALSEVEMAQRLEERRLQQLTQQRAKEMLRRDQSLLARYPNRESHEAQRQLGLQQVDALLTMSYQRLGSLEAAEHEVRESLAAYTQKHEKAPLRLLTRQEEVARELADLKAQIASQEADKRRIQARFDEELQRLVPLWSKQSAAATPSL